MTIQLGERQVGFDAHKLGFPSVDGCMAIVVVLPEGLYGYHSLGGERSTDWPRIVRARRTASTHSRRSSGVDM